jgi:L-asparaginase
VSRHAPTPAHRRSPRLASIVVLALAAVPVVAAGQPATVPAPAPQQASAPAAGLPRVRLIATGGTISNRRGGRLTADELLASIPNLATFVRAESEQFANLASSELTLVQLLDLARRANAVLAADPGLAGLVVTSGTDTLEEIAYFLHLTVKDDRPVVVVGSMRNPSALGYEGAANLLAGFRVAADPASRAMGTLVVLNDEINAAREVTKGDALRLNTFQSRGAGVLGVVDADRIAYVRRPIRRAGSRTEFDVGPIAALPRVDVLLAYQDAPGDLIEAAVVNGARGLVIATAGAGATSGTQEEALRYAHDKGVAIVRTTRTGAGRIATRTPAGDPAEPDRRVPTIAAEDLSPVKARMLLMLALASGASREEIQRMFLEY